MNPSSRTTLQFDGNTAHSSGYFWVFGSCIYVGGELKHDPTNNNLLIYKSGRNARDTRVDGVCFFPPKFFLMDFD